MILQVLIIYLLRNKNFIYWIVKIITCRIHPITEMHIKDSKKAKSKPSPSHHSNSLSLEIKSFIRNCNLFLKNNFEFSQINFTKYAQCVKEFFIQESTNI